MKLLLSRLRAIGTPSLYRKHASIFFQGEIPRNIVVVLDGVIKAYTISPEGEETIVNLFGKGSIIPVAWANGQSPTSLFNYSAVNDVRVLKLSRDNFIEALHESPETLSDYIEFLSQSQAGLMLRVTGLCQPRATEKICYTLYYLLFRYGLEREGGMFEIDLKITQSMLANLIGQTRESTAKNLKVLRGAGVVAYTSSTYMVNKRKLEQYMGEDSFRNLTLSV